MEYPFFNVLTKFLLQTKSLMGEVMKEAAFSLAEAKFTVGSDFNTIVLQNVTKAQIKVWNLAKDKRIKFIFFIKVKTRKDNVAGVILPVFESYQDGTDSNEFAGLARGGQQLGKLKRNYARAIQLLVDLASLQTCFITLDEVIKVLNKKIMNCNS